MCRKELIFIDKNFKSKEQLFDFISAQLLAQNIVKHTFNEAIKNRESKFPTGLLFVDNCGVAIPHTESIHCLENTISFFKLDNPLTFLDMEEGKQKIDVQYVFVLTLTDPNGHIDVLQNLFSLISAPEFFEKLKLKQTSERILEFLNSKFKE